MEIIYETGQPKGRPCAAMEFGPEYTLHTFYLAPANAYLRIAAISQSFEWE